MTSKLHIPDHRVLNIHRRENMKPHLSPGTKDIFNGAKFTQLSAGNTVTFHSWSDAVSTKSRLDGDSSEMEL